MKVVKFGGVVLQTPEGFKRMASVVGNGFKGIVVVSALSTTTRRLDFIAKLAVKGLLAEATEASEQLLEEHELLAKTLVTNVNIRLPITEAIDSVKKELREFCQAVSVAKQLTPRTLDSILALGEFLALEMVTTYLLLEGISASSVSATRFMITNDRFGGAEPLFEKCRLTVQSILVPALSARDVVVVQGFVGGTEQGITTTMGKESSNLTASMIGSILGVEEIVIYTDVQGVRSADPHNCESTSIRAHLSYQQAELAAEHGLKLLYPTMIAPARQMNVPIRIIGAAEPDGEFTVINAVDGEVKPIVIVSPKSVTRSVVTTVFCDTTKWLEAAHRIIREGMKEADYVAGVDSSKGLAWLECDNSLANSASSAFHTYLCTYDT